MSPETLAAVAAAAAAVAAAVLSLVALPFTIRAANAARAQTELQRQIAAEARLPLLWADLRPDPERRAVMCLFVGNNGPTLARGVRLVVSPPVLPGPTAMSCEQAQADAAAGISALPPGRVLTWSLGVGHELLAVPDQPEEFTLTLTGTAPDGTALSESFAVRFGDIRHTSATQGTAETFVQEFKHARRERREDHRELLGAVRDLSSSRQD